ncbi:hypothetical protein HPULCUR_002671 [Helicostylum pulchrum]|uniref:Uncharacterized protein n=1 Tax=Helicostylum pulchrum TaxID=562976 RepID=A0ABP9XSG0_9FUNG
MREAQAADAVRTISQLTYKGQKLSAEYTPQTETDVRENSARKGKKKGKIMIAEEDDHRTPDEKLADQVTPLWKVDYETQLVKKNRNSIKQLISLKRKIAELKNVRDESQIDWAYEKGALPCEVLDPIGSPVTEGYRTKCEFTIGYNLNREPTVGFLLGLYRDGVTSVLEPSACLNVPDVAKKIAAVMNEYIKKSDLPAYDRVEKTGVWRTLMTKTQSTGDVLILVQIRAADLTAERLQQEKDSLVKFWNEDSGVNVTTLVFQVWDGSSNGMTDKAPIEVLSGNGYIHENLLGNRFRLSASAFFQVNTPATEILYAKCAEWCAIDPTKKTTLLDLCCGTGTIGITMAKSVEHVIGIEMVPEAIVDAKVNAELNGTCVYIYIYIYIYILMRVCTKLFFYFADIKNVTYYASKVEDKINVVTDAVNEEVIAVLDPPRNGVHASVIRAIRDAKHISRVIYISCDSKQAIDNFIALCRPTSNRFRGMPFKPVRAVTVDLFPHTEHCELMVEFVRVEEQEEEEEEVKKEEDAEVKKEEGKA